MSFVKLKKCIELGDTILNRRGELVDHVFQTVYGALRVVDLVGVQYGSKVQLSKGWGFVLAPTCDLWTQSLPHRTQILYSPDIAMVLMQLQLRPGSRVIEAGTGSGSLSHAILRTVKPNGSLFTFDFHEDRATVAREEFESHGYVSPLVQVFQRDVCKLGFDIDEALNGMSGDGEKSISTAFADAVFLDLPLPWEAVPLARKVLKKGGRIATFSPCIEQVQKTREALIENNFFEVSTSEGLSQELQVQYRTHAKLSKSVGEPGRQNDRYLTSFPAAVVPGHTGFLTFATLKPF